MESNALEKSTKKDYHLEIFGMTSFDDSTDCKNLWCCGSVSPKNTLILPKNFLDFSLDAIEKQSIINLSHSGNKGYASIVLDDSEVTFHRGEEDATFC